MRDDALITALAVELPSARQDLLAVAKSLVVALNAAVVAGDRAAASAAQDRYDAVVWKLNGGTFFGCEAGEGGGVLARRFCAADPGEIPLWGQGGEFLIEVRGIRAVACLSYCFGRMNAGFSFNAIDPSAPFISPTGFRHEFTSFWFGSDVAKAAEGVFGAQLEIGRVWVSEDYRGRVEASRWPWLDPHIVPAQPVHEPDGQFVLAL